MSGAIRQWFKVPNTNSTSVASVSGSFGNTALQGGGVRGATLPNSRIVVIGTYSYDITSLGSVSDAQGNDYELLGHIADTTAASKGHQNYNWFDCQNANALGANDEIVFQTTGTDWTDMVAMEITGTSGSAFTMANWQQNISGGAANDLNSGKVLLPTGEYFILSCSCNASTEGASPPYAPSAGDRMTAFGTWANDTQIGDYDINTLATYFNGDFSCTTPTMYESYFTTPPSSNLDNFVTFVMAFPVVGGSGSGTTINLTKAQVAALAGGTSVSLTAPAAIPAGGSITLLPPSVSSGYTPSAPGTTIMAGSSATITDNSGNQWGINSSALVTVAVYPSTTLVPDTTTANVTELYFGANGYVYQENTAGGWWYKATPTDTWHSTSNPTGSGGQTATPTISPNGGNFTSPQTVTLKCATTGALMFYTTDGSTPTTASTKYSTPFTVSSSETVNVLAVSSGNANSSASATFIITSSNGGNLPNIQVPIFMNGTFYGSGDWNNSSNPMNYSYQSAGVDGDGPVIDWPAYGNNPYWLPYKQNAPGNGNPASNGVGYNVTGCTYFTFAVKPSAPGLDLQMYLYIAQGSQDDIYYNTTPLDVCQSKYLVSGPGMGAAGEWSVYKVPLADFGPVLDWYYKINIFKEGGNPTQDCTLDQVGFG